MLMDVIRVFAVAFAFVVSSTMFVYAFHLESDKMICINDVSESEVHYITSLYRNSALFFLAFCVLIK